MVVLPWSTPLPPPPSRCVTCRCLICFTLPYPSPPVGETSPRANAAILRRCSRTSSRKLHGLFAFLLCENFWCNAIAENRLRTATKFPFQNTKCCFSDLTPRAAVTGTQPPLEKFANRNIRKFANRNIPTTPISASDVARLDCSGLFRRRNAAMARTYNCGCNVILGCRPGIGKRTVGTIELVPDILATRANPRFVEAGNSQRPPIRKSDGFRSVVDQQDHTFLRLDRVAVSGLVGNNDFSRRTIELSARLFGPTHLYQLC
jgi:hypothetical protein